MTEEKFIKYYGKDVEIKLNSGETITGHCESFTRAVDSDTKVASLTIATQDGYFEIYQNDVTEIKTITP